MKASDLIEQLRQKMEEHDGDPEVLVQSAGCCRHGHEILVVEFGQQSVKGVDTSDEIGAVVIRC